MSIDWTKVVTAKQKVAAAKAEKAQADIAAALKYLTDTDWYVIRLVEQGRAIPESVKAGRTAARKTLNPPGRRG
jgi:F0F1-type ATP synthase gamma subunit